MSVDTEIQGRPGSITSAATWLSRSLAPELSTAADSWNAARRAADASWQGVAGEQCSGVTGRGRDLTDGLEQATKDMATDLDTFAGKLAGCQHDMSTIRSEALASGLTVSGFLISDPGPGPARPPDGFEGTEAEVAAHNTKVEQYDAHQVLITAYHHATSEAARIDRQYDTACRALQGEYTVGQHAGWILRLSDIAAAAATSSVGLSIAKQQSKLATSAQGLVDEATAAIKDLQAHPERYLKRKWLIFETLDTDKLAADKLAIEGKLSEAEALLKDSRAAGDAPAPRNLKIFGRVLGAAGLGLGVYNDYQEGESSTQIAVSQGASAGLGILATIGTSAAVGAAVGSVIPVGGTVVGAVVGTVVGAGIAIFSDGAIDSLFENGPDVGAAFDSGLDALADTGGAIKDGISGVGGAIGGLFD